MRLFVFLAALAMLPAMTVAQNSDPQIWSGVFSTPQADRGRTVFTAHGARCPGENRSVRGDIFMLIRNPAGDRINVMRLEPLPYLCE